MTYKEPNKIDYQKHLKVFVYISFATLLTYAIMAVITHFSLNYEAESYEFNQSLQSIFDTETDMFKFFAGFVVIYVVWILSAVILQYIKKSVS